ncbi:hypothetical protein SESBI_13193, partial [Sesbania bispinosa]
ELMALIHKQDWLFNDYVERINRLEAEQVCIFARQSPPRTVYCQESIPPPR